MFKNSFAGRYAAALLALALSASSAAALTGEDLMTKMGEDERNGYLTGAVEMAAFIAHQQGDPERLSCIMDWFFGGGSGPEEIVQALNHFKDRQAHPVLFVLMNRTCAAD
jgi:hypothetical protein